MIATNSLPTLHGRVAAPGALPRPVLALPPLQAVKLLEQVRERIRYLHYSRRTEYVYVSWIRLFIRFHKLRHPRELGTPEVEAFLSWLANAREVAPSTHKQALAALLFLYGKVLGLDLPWLKDIGSPRVQTRLPVVLTLEEVTAIVTWLQGEHRLFARLLYGTGMRINEALQLRVKDIDFSHKAIIVRCGKGGKDRVVMLPSSLVTGLREQLSRARAFWDADQAAGRAGVFMPHALDRKYPRAGASWSWFWVFPQATHSTDPQSGVVRRHHMYDQTFQRAFKKAVRQAGIPRLATPHTLRHSFATELLRNGYDIRTVQELLGHTNVCHDDDLYARSQAGWRRGAQSGGCHGWTGVEHSCLSPAPNRLPQSGPSRPAGNGRWLSEPAPLAGTVVTCVHEIPPGRRTTLPTRVPAKPTPAGIDHRGAGVVPTSVHA